MKLFHGTSAAAVPAILEHGIVPRGERDGNWRHANQDSVPDFVYLSSVYAGYFALNAAQDSEGIAIVEVDTGELKTRQLYPDEDFIVSVIRADMPVDEARKFAHETIEAHQRHWRSSLMTLGNIAHRGTIPLNAVVRITTLDNLDVGLRMAITDAQISPSNYRFCSSKYREITKLLTGKPVDPKIFTMELSMLRAITPETDRQWIDHAIDAWARIVENTKPTVVYERP